jgi:hypothetical protein
LFTLAENAKCSPPDFVASYLKRVPTVVPGDVDIYAMAATQVSELSKKVDDLTQEVNKDKVTYGSRLEKCELALKHVEKASGSHLDSTWAHVAATPAQQSLTIKKAPIPVRVRGSAGATAIKAVSRPIQVPLLKAFVGRLDLDTSEDELRNFLTVAGLNVVHCRKLKVPEGKMFKSAAFYVACSEDCKDNFYNEATWPEGVE